MLANVYMNFKFKSYRSVYRLSGKNMNTEQSKIYRYIKSRVFLIKKHTYKQYTVYSYLRFLNHRNHAAFHHYIFLGSKN